MSALCALLNQPLSFSLILLVTKTGDRFEFPLLSMTKDKKNYCFNTIDMKTILSAEKYKKQLDVCMGRNLSQEKIPHIKTVTMDFGFEFECECACVLLFCYVIVRFLFYFILILYFSLSLYLPFTH